MCAVEECEPWAVVRHEQRTAREHWYDGYVSPTLGRLAAGVRLGWCEGRMPVPEHAAADARRQLGQVA